MQYLFSPNHVRLVAACYPPSSALLTSGPDYRPNSQELSRLTYYGSNHPEKLNKLGSELEKRIRTESRKARAGNIRSRVSLLIALSILRALATECRRDIPLLSPSLITSVNITVSTLPTDLEVVARAASVFTAWTTYTDGHLIGADSAVTQNYLSCLRSFANLSSVESKSSDQEVRNRTRLVGLAALTGALNSEALFNDSTQFRAQVRIIIRPLLKNILQVDLSILDEQSTSVKQASVSPYLAEFRNRPAMERRAVSIHVHVDGDKGPSTIDVTNASLHAFFSLLEHSNGAQLGFIMQAALSSLDELQGWEMQGHCCWFAQKSSEWSQYQYRYAVPTWLVERLLESQDAPQATALHTTLAAMITTVFNSSTPLVNLSTSDIISNLITLVLRRTSIDPEDSLLPALVECIASLGTHVYYADQIQDLAGELISRLVIVEVQGIPGRGKSAFTQARSQTVRCLLAGLSGLIQASEKNEHPKEAEGAHLHRKPTMNASSNSASPTLSNQESSVLGRPSRRSRIAPEVWQETLSLLCDNDYAVRADYADALVFYLTTEIPKHGDLKHGDFADVEGVKRVRPLEAGPFKHATNMNVVLHGGDPCTRFLNAIHAYLYILATSSSLGLSTNSSPSPAHSSNGEILIVNVLPATPLRESPTGVGTTKTEESSAPSQNHGRRSLNVSPAPRSRKLSVVQRLVDRVPSRVSSSATACAADYVHILDTLVAVHEQLPVRGLLAGVPMLLALDASTRVDDASDTATMQRVYTIREVTARVWLAIAKVWNCVELAQAANKALSSIPGPSFLPNAHQNQSPLYNPPRQAVPFTSADSQAQGDSWSGIDVEIALMALVTSQHVQEATGLDRPALLRRLAIQWTVDFALKESVERASHFNVMRGDGVSPLLKISPALMHIENLSLQSLTRSTRGVGVTDLREALEGRSSMSNPALVKPGSISTLDHVSSVLGSDMTLSKLTRSRTKKRMAATAPGEVRDVLNRLGIGRQNGGSLLKASFPAAQKSDQRTFQKP